jgi:UDPglucose 6-dehydrogenase
MKFKITIFGTGYVGLITGICLADIGHKVICVDVDSNKINCLRQGKSPIYEPGLDDLLARNIAAKNIEFTTDAKVGIQHGEVQFIAVGTPQAGDGAADLTYVYRVATSIGEYLEHDCVVVNKSTVPVGTADKVQQIIQAELDKRDIKVNFALVSNPEFLKQGDAINDFFQASRIVVGSEDQMALEKMRLIYKPVIDQGQKFISMDIRSAELTKYAANAFLANKISFINEMSKLAGQMGADIDNIRLGIGSDPRIGEHFLQAGCGYGGSCFPKDVKALMHSAAQHNCEVSLLDAIDAVNQKQKQIIFQGLRTYFNNELKDKTIALWGLAFKPNTDDMREATSGVLLEQLWQAGSKVQAYDPVAMPTARTIYGARDDFILCNSAHDALENADALVIITEWNEFKNPNFDLIKQKLNNQVIFDGRNLFHPQQIADLGIEYYCIGRGRAL